MSFPLNWTETGADQQSNNWGTLLRNWALAQHDAEGAHGALTFTSGSVSGDLSVMGKLGVGTASPVFPVDIQETNATTNVRITDNVNGARLRLTAATVNVDIYNSGGSGQIGTQTNHNFAFVTNNATRGSISNAGLWSIGLPASSLNAVAFDVLLQNNSNIRGANAGGTNTHQLIGINTGDQVVIATGTNNVRLATGGGLVQIATAVTSGGAGGDLILSNAKNVSFVNAAGTTALSSLSLNGNNHVVLGGNGTSVIIAGGTATATGANIGDIVVASSKFYRAANNANTAAIPLIGLVTASNIVQIAGESSTPQLCILGVPSTTSGAAAGDFITANAKSHRWSNAAGSSALDVLQLDASDRVRLGAGGGVLLMGAPGTSTGSSAGDMVIANARDLRASNAAASSAVSLIGFTSGNVVALARDLSILTVGQPASTTNAATGDIVLANNRGLRVDNAAGTSALSAVRVNASDQVEIAADGGDIRWGRANVALGGGAAPTFGTIGGSGPAAAAQRAWLRVIESDGTASFIPIWR